MNLSELKEIINKEVEKTFVPHLEKIEPNEIDSVLSVGDKSFGTFAGNSKTVSQNPGSDNKNLTDWDKSIKLVLNKKTIGFYLFSTKTTVSKFVSELELRYNMKVTINNQELTEYAESHTGIQGLVVGILPKYQKKGYSKLLFDYPKNLGYDYVWAVQTEGMSNLSGWLKRAELLLTINHYSGQKFYITIEKF
jgi:hypothetical protein